MIELIFCYFMIQQDLFVVGGTANAQFNRRLQIAATMIETREIYIAAEKKWKDDESTLERFYAFWENVDSGDTRGLKLAAAVKKKK